MNQEFNAERHKNKAMRKVKIIETGEVGYFHQFDMHECVIIELEDGTMCNRHYLDIQFIDSTENEQLAEFAKTAMHGIISNAAFSNLKSKPYDIAFLAIVMAKELISELKKQKP